MNVRDGDNTEIIEEEEFSLESLSPEDQKKFLDAVKDGQDSVELTVAVPEAKIEEPATPALEPAAAELVVEPVKKAKPTNFAEAMDAWNTANQKLQARERLLEKIGSNPQFALEYLHERGIPLYQGQDAVAEARKLEAAENVNAAQVEQTNRVYADSVSIAITHADTVLSEYGATLGESLAQADAKWIAVFAELGNDEEKARQYINDPEFRKTVKAEGPKSPAQYLAAVNAVKAWMKDHNTPLHKYLAFHDVAKDTPAGKPAPSIADHTQQATAVRLAAKADEPQTLPTSTGSDGAPTFVAVQDLLDKAERIGTDNLSKEERARIHQFYA